MFLHQLNNDQKDDVLDLCIHAANSNGNFDDKQKFMVTAYANEMKIDVRFEAIKGVDESIKNLKEISSKKDLKAITFELLSMLLSDKIFDDFEKELINKISKEFCLDMSTIDEMSKISLAMIENYEKISLIVNN